MKRELMLSLAAVALAALTSGCVVYPRISGSGVMVSETRAVSDFDAVSVGGSGILRIRQGDRESLEVRVDDNLLPYLRTEVSGGKLKIWWDRGNLRFSEQPEFILEVKRLEELSLSGSLHAEMDSLSAEQFEAQISGSGKIHLGELEARKAKFGVSGSGDIAVDGGRAESLDVRISGSGNARMQAFKANDVDLSISGSGNAEVQALERLDANVSGSGNVVYFGSPAVNSSVSGSGRVRKG